MKKKLFLTAGILIAIGSVYGAKHRLAPGSGEKVSAVSHTGRSAVLQTTIKEQSEALAEDQLTAKIEQLRRWVCGREPSLDRETAMKILGEWADRDAHAALDFVCAAPHFPRRNFAYAIPLAKICRREPKEVIGWLSHQITVADDRTEIAESIIQRIERDAPVVALELANAPGIPVGIELFGELLGRMARTQPQIALQAFAQKTLDGQKRVIGSMLYYWAQTNPNEALAWYQGRGETDAGAARSLATGCIKSGQYTIADLVQRLSLSTEQADRMLFQLSRDGVALDPQTLVFFSEHARQRAAEAAAWNLENSPDRVVAFVKAALGANYRAEALVGGWRSWLSSDRKAALEWLQQLPDRQLANELPARLERQEQLRDPHKALAIAATIANQEERRDVVMTAVQRLVWEEPAEAAAWLAQNPNDAPRPESYGMLTRNYLERDDAGAMAWLVKLSAGEARDEALSAAAKFWAGREIEFAAASIAAIGDTQKRQQCMFSLYCNLNRTNTAKADQWLATQGLSAEVRQSWKALGQTSTMTYDQ
jgi:hypothetical protein